MSLITDVAALYDDAGKPSPLLKTVITHFKDRFREVLKRAGAPASVKTKSASVTDDKGSLLTLEASFPAGDASAAVELLTAAAGRLFTPTMKGAGLTFAGLSAVTKLFPLKGVGAVAMEVHEAAGQISVKAGLAVLHPEAKPLEKELAVKTVKTVPPVKTVAPAAPPAAPSGKTLYVGSGSGDTMEWSNPVKGVSKVKVQGSNLAVLVTLIAPRAANTSVEVIFRPPEAMLTNARSAGLYLSESAVMLGVVKPLLDALKPVLKLLPSAFQVYALGYGVTLERFLEAPSPYRLVWLPDLDFDRDSRLALRRTWVSELEVASVRREHFSVSYSAKNKPQVKVSSEDSVQWSMGRDGGSLQGGDVTSLIPRFHSDFLFEGRPPAALVDVKAGKILHDELPERFEALSKDAAFLKGKLRTNDLFERAKEVGAAFDAKHTQQSAALADRARSMTPEQVARILERECPLDDVAYDNDGPWRADPSFGRDKEGYDEEGWQFQEWSNKLDAALERNFGGALTWTVGDKGWIWVYRR
jgi:hypothetical protein